MNLDIISEADLNRLLYELDGWATDVDPERLGLPIHFHERPRAHQIIREWLESRRQVMIDKNKLGQLINDFAQTHAIHELVKHVAAVNPRVPLDAAVMEAAGKARAARNALRDVFEKVGDES